MGSKIVNLTIAAAILIAVAMIVGAALGYHAGRSGAGRLMVSCAVLGVAVVLLIASFRLQPSR